MQCVVARAHQSIRPTLVAPMGGRRAIAVVVRSCYDDDAKAPQAPKDSKIARLDHLKQVAKQAVSQKQRSIAKVVSAMREIIEAERELAADIVEEIKGIARDDVKIIRERTNISIGRFEDERDEQDASEEKYD